MTSKSVHKERIFYLDQLRALAIIAILLVHISDIWCLVGGNGITYSYSLTYNFIVSYIYQGFALTGVPIFFMLSGALLLNRDYEISIFLKKRLQRVIIPLLFWTFVFIMSAPSYFPKFFNLTSGIVYVSELIFYNNPYWFVWMIIGVYLAMPVINDFVKIRGLKGVKYFLILWISFSTLYIFSQYFGFSWNSLDVTLFVGPFGLVLLGYYLYINEFNYSPHKLVLFGFILFFFALLLRTFLMVNGFVYEFFSYYLFNHATSLEVNLCTFLEVIGIFLIFKYLNRCETGILSSLSKILERNLLKKLTTSLSRCSYGIYFNHFIIIGLISIVSSRYFNINLVNYNPLILIPILLIIVIILGWTIIIILNKMPFMKKLTGYH